MAKFTYTNRDVTIEELILLSKFTEKNDYEAGIQLFLKRRLHTAKASEQEYLKMTISEFTQEMTELHKGLNEALTIAKLQKLPSVDGEGDDGQ